MSRNRKTNRRSRTFQIESLDRRQMLSATGWSANITTNRETDATSPIAYVAKLDMAGNLIHKPIDNVFATSAAAATAEPTARAQSPSPYTVTKKGSVLTITATRAGNQIRVNNYFKDSRTGRVTVTIDHFGRGGGPFAQTIDVTGVKHIVYKGTNGDDVFENKTWLTSTQYGKGGNDSLIGGFTADYLYGGVGNDHLNGRGGNDELYGGKNGARPIATGAGRLGDELYGGGGNDKLHGGAGSDHLDGQGDLDTAIHPQSAMDRLVSIERVTRTASASVSALRLNAALTPPILSANALSASRSLTAPPPTPGTLDSEFGKGGKLTKHFFTVEDYAKSVAIQGQGPDAKLIVVGQIGDDVGIARFDADGDLDTSFGDWDVQRMKYKGFTKLNFSGYHESGFGVAIEQETGRIFVAATINSGNESAVICLTKDGKLDHSFGERVIGGRKGYRVIDFKGGTDIALDLAIDNDRNIVVVGSTDNEDATAAKLTRDGDVVWQTKFDFKSRHCIATAVAIDKNNDVIVVGKGDKHGYGVARLSGMSGKVVMATTINFGTGTTAYDVAIDSKDRIVVVGNTLSGAKFGVARLNSDGSPDKSFSRRSGEPTGGKVEIDWNGSDGARGVVIDPFDNGIYVVGRARSYGFGIVRLTGEGKLDSDFSPHGTDPGPGRAIAPFGGGAEAWGVTLDHERRVVVVGNDKFGDFAMARLHGTPLQVPGTITMDPTTVTVNESVGTVEVKVKLDRGTIGNKNVTVDYSLIAGSAGSGDFGSGPAPSKSIQRGNKLTFGTSKTEATIVIPITNDKVHEEPESFQVKLSNPTPGVNLGNDTSTITIVDDDPAKPDDPLDPNPNDPSKTSLAIQPDGSVEKQEGAGTTTTFRFQVTRSGNTSGETTVHWAVAGRSNNGVNGADFVGGKLPSGVVKFAAGSTTPEYIDINVVGDAHFEPDEQFTVTLSNASDSAQITRSSANGMIISDEQSPIRPSFLEITRVGNVVKQEGTGSTTTYTFRVNRRGYIEGYTTARWAVTGTANDGADAADFFKGKLPSGGVAFNPFEKTYEFQIKVAGDARVEGNDQFTVTLSDQSADAIITTASVTCTINDDDVADPVPEVKLNRHGRLIIQGSRVADNVAVSIVKGRVVVTFDGRHKDFAAASVKALEFHGGKGDDRFTNNTSIRSEIYGDDGRDTLLGGRGMDILRGSDGKDWIDGREGNDELYGGGNDDTLLGGDGNDRLHGGDGTDHVDGGAGDDHLEGGHGNDGMYGGDGRDFLFGQEDNDWLYGGFGDDELYGVLGADQIYGEAGDDKLRGGRGGDILKGGDGNDDLDGEEDDDKLYGDDGNDRLVSRDGKAGNDQLFGGLGKNVFDAPRVEIK